MITDIFSKEVQQFISNNENADVNDLLLRYKEIAGVPLTLIVNQISGRKKAKDKLPVYYKNQNIYYPPGVNLEQSSSQQTANYKQQILRQFFNETSVKAGVDLTGGFGVDSYFLSRLCDSLHYVERNQEILSIAEHNHNALLDPNNILYHPGSAEDFISQFSGEADFIFIDPSRRVSGNTKVFKLSDCDPDITLLQNRIFEITSLLMVKASPLLDISIALEELRFVKEVIVVSVDNECKELLFISDKNSICEPIIRAVNFQKGLMETFDFTTGEERAATVITGEPDLYLYEPNASILKAGAFKSVANKFQLTKLHASTHLYTSNNLDSNFPGKIFLIEHFVKPEAKSLKNLLPEGKANITTRNYPLSVEQLKKKTGLKDGGSAYLIGFTDVKKKNLVIAKRLK